MASDIAQTSQLANGDAADAYQSPLDSNHVNGTNSGDVADSQIPPTVSKVPAETPLQLKETTSAIPNEAADSSSLENVSSGIQPVADFLPKEASNLSHPTPPPDEPLTTGEADADVSMADASSSEPPVEGAQASSQPEPSIATEHASAPVPVPVSALAPATEPSPSLVRPREDDETEEPAAKRSRIDDEARVDLPILPVPAAATPEASAPPAPAVDGPPTTLPSVDAPSTEIAASDELPTDVPVADADVPVTDAPAIDVPAVDAPAVGAPAADAPTASEPIAAEVPSSEPQSVPAAAPSIPTAASGSVEEPSIPTTEMMADPVETKADPSLNEIKEEAASMPALPAAVDSTDETADVADQSAKPSSDETATALPSAADSQMTTTTAAPTAAAEPAAPAAPAADAPPAPATSSAEQAPAAERPKHDDRPMTSVQKRVLTEKMRNIKKTKPAIAFLKPVDAIALNIPKYYEVVTNPMDLSTMEGKLKDDKYKSVQDFANDFDLIVQNARLFNGPAHPVTVAGLNLEAYFNRIMQTVPSADEPAPVAPSKDSKKRSPSAQRESRPRARKVTGPEAPAAAAAAAAPAPAAAGSPPAASTTYALQNDGTPQLRRDSNRPQRAIKPPQNREITYAKPKRKEHQPGLRFCEHILEQLRSPKYGTLNHVFLHPVDAVALQIPNYHSIIKHPMDLATMSNKLKGGQYTTANEFKKDFELMVKNCLTFNPMGNPVHDIGVKFQREFDALWAEKTKWERQNQPASNRASSASVADEDSDDEEEEEFDAGLDDKEAQILSLQKQLQAMQETLNGVVSGGKAPKTKKAKTSKSAGSKKSSTTVPVKPKGATSKAGAKPKKPKQVSYEEKQEISEAVGRMSETQVGRLTHIITTNCEKYRDMDEMELEIDDLPNDVQAKLLEYVRSIFGKPKKQIIYREPSPDDAAAMDDDDFEPESRARGGAGGKRKKHKPMGKKEQTDTIRSLQDKLAQFSGGPTSGSESPTNGGYRNANAQAESSGDEESEESEEE